MNTIELSQLTLHQKFQIMQQIWDEMRSKVDGMDIPPSHRKILDERRSRVENGESKLLDWDEIKHSVGMR